MPKVTDRNVLGIAAYFRDWPSQYDLTAFMKEYPPTGPTRSFTLVKTTNGQYPAQANNEADIIIQYAEVITYPTPNTSVSTASPTLHGGGLP